MGADYIVGVDCTAKIALGNGNALAGASTLIELLKASNRLDLIRDLVRQNGEDPDAVRLSVRRNNADGTTSEEALSIAGMESQAAALCRFTSDCETCPANFKNNPFGCCGAVPYAISEVNERWLISLVQPAGSIGGDLLLAALKDFDYTGEPAATARARGMFESPKPLSTTLVRKLFGGTKVTSDQIFQAILFVGALQPSHCLGLLLWLGAIEFDGRPLRSIDEAPRLNVMRSLPVSERLKRTRLAIPQPDDGGREMYDLLAAMLSGWQNDVRLYIDA